MKNINWNDIGFIIISDYRKRILFELFKRECTPKMISEKTSISINHVSNIIKELKNSGFITCLNPDLKKGRFYKITTKGKEIINIIEKINMKGE